MKPDCQTQLTPIPTEIKERISLTALTPDLEERLKAIQGQQAIVVTIPGSEAKAIVREQFLYDLINLCNTLMFDKFDDMQTETDPLPSAEERERLLQQSLAEIDKLYGKED